MSQTLFEIHTVNSLINDGIRTLLMTQPTTMTPTQDRKKIKKK